MQKVGVAFSISKTFKHFWFILLERFIYLRLKLMIGDPLKCRLTIITFATPSWGQLYSFSWMFESTVTPLSLKATKLFYSSYCFLESFLLFYNRILDLNISSFLWTTSTTKCHEADPIPFGSTTGLLLPTWTHKHQRNWTRGFLQVCFN